MKFSEVPTGSKFKNTFYYRKISSDIIYNYATGNTENAKWFNNGLDQEVELVTKCDNCTEKRSSESGYKYYFCNELKEDLNKDPATFSCSLFDLKEG